MYFNTSYIISKLTCREFSSLSLSGKVIKVKENLKNVKTTNALDMSDRLYAIIKGLNINLVVVKKVNLKCW